MHQYIRVLVPGPTQDDALARAHNALDELVGVGVDAVSAYDYYGTFDQADSRYKPHVANVISDDNSELVDDKTVAPAFPLDSEEGIRFEASTADDGTVVELEMVNGGEVPVDSRVALSDANGRGMKKLSEPVTPGDSLSLSLSLSDGNELLIGTDGTPESARALEEFVRATVRHGGFELFVMESRLYATDRPRNHGFR